MSEQLWTIKDVMEWSIPFLKEKGSPSARLDAELLLCEVMQCRRLDLYLDHHKPLSLEERQGFRNSIRRRAAGEPVAYILGQKEFFGLNFKVGPATLVPRPETEHLVEAVINSMAEGAGVQGVDIGTGSGCIAIALKSQRPDWQLEAWDISADALSIAAENAHRHGASITFRDRDALNPLGWLGEPDFDFIVTNPPYIAPAERPDLPKSVLGYEPGLALFALQEGLEFYNSFAKHAPRRLRAGGKIFLEIGSKQASDVCLRLEESGWRNISVQKDIAGLDRVVQATRPLD